MAYCTRAQIETRFGATNIEKFAKLGDGESDATILARITAAIVQADDEIDLALVQMYPDSVPFSTVPTLIASISIDLAASFLYDSRGVVEWGDDDDPRNRMSFAAKRARKQIASIQAGQITLPVTDADKPAFAPAVIEDDDSDDDASTVGWTEGW